MTACEMCHCRLAPSAKPCSTAQAGCAAPAEEQPAMPCDEYALAIHEAAHAVFAIAGAHTIDHATIVGGAGYLGQVLSLAAKGQASLEANVLILLAGPYAGGLIDAAIDPLTTPSRMILPEMLVETAQAIAAGTCVVPCDRDECKALHLLRRRRRDAGPQALMMDMNRAASHVGGLIRRPAVWSAIAEVADLLIRRRTCGDGDIRPIVVKWLGDATLSRLSSGLIPRLLPIRSC
ncbi:MAG: hypothetical protein K2Z25_22420 [Beijerinckiaceae bacterium]|nr:hypothetical protein [Beijerinckiaceae bacterium]